MEYDVAGAAHSALFDLDGLADHPDFLRLLRTTHVRSMHTLDATLEDVFVAVTGARLT